MPDRASLNVRSQALKTALEHEIVAVPPGAALRLRGEVGEGNDRMRGQVSSDGVRALPVAIPCEGCGVTFEPRRRHRRHCRAACRARSS